MIDQDTARAIAAGQLADLFGVLGAHPDGEGWVVRAFVPGAEAVTIQGGPALAPQGHDVFAARLPDHPGAYRLRASRGGDTWEIDDPYRYPPVLGDLDEHLIAEGSHGDLHRVLGAHLRRHEGTEGATFAVWAPAARRVSVVGDFNQWDGRRHVMRPRGTTGVWEIFVPGIAEHTLYKYEVAGADGAVQLKADPVGFGAEMRPNTCSVVRRLDHDWRDGDWMAGRAARQSVGAPISIYEVHLGSWRRPGGYWLDWRQLADELVPYARDMGFTHIETLPITEHPFDGSWGYQPLGLFAPTSRHGDMYAFREFVEACHAAGLGLILDWVPAHFPADAHGLARFDGTHLYEHQDPRQGYHPDWNTLIFNLGRREVVNYLVANAKYWLGEHHIDGLRVDAVASMLYLDYSREAGGWVPNRHGGRENLEAIDFLRRMNAEVYGADPSVMTIAEESTAWPGVSRPAHHGGLGFGFKWNMGWMHDTLQYIARDPIHRRHHHGDISFGLHYAFSENFVLPLSHDEVVHGKGSILSRMPGDRWAQFANLRAYYAFMFAHPGKKLLFMGNELAQAAEWTHEGALDWAALDDPLHAGVQALIRDLNGVYRDTPALHAQETEAAGFQWVDGAAEAQSVYAWLRLAAGHPPVLCVMNFSGAQHEGWRVGVPASGRWTVRVNSDAAAYGGAGRGPSAATADPVPSHGLDQSVELTLPPLTVLLLEHAG